VPVQFGRDLKRGAGKPRIDAAALELLPLAVLRREAAAAGLAAHQAEKKDRPLKLVEYSRLALEVARRTGEVESLTKAVNAADRAARLCPPAPIVAAARLAQAQAAVLGGQLFAQPTAQDVAQACLAVAEVAAAPGLADEALAVRARIEGMRALAGADLDAAVEAAGVFDAAVERFDARASRELFARVEAAALRCDRADLLIAFGLRLRDRPLLVQAEADLRQLQARLDPDVVPLTWARTESMRGQAQAALGDILGDARTLADSVRTLAAAAEHADFAYSPLDRARISHALALSLQSLAEASEDSGLFDHAMAVFDQALVSSAATPSLPLRAVLIYDRTACLALRSERTGDLAGLGRAESSFRMELSRRTAESDPVSWAVAQLALTRLYEVRAQLKGAPSPPETAVALTEAADVFAEHGLATLARQAEDALARLRAATARP
jgi:tetratricopeptide (TPR) repeat protein